MFVVTGCGRSGTGYTAKLLTALGVACGHERVFTPWTRAGAISFGDLRGDASWLAAPLLAELPEDLVVLHQVRDPAAVIRSFMGIGTFAMPLRAGWAARASDAVELARRAVSHHHRRPIRRDFIAFVRRYEPAILRPAGELDRCIEYWIRWNGLVEEGTGRRPSLRIRVEDLDEALVARILDLVGEHVPVERIRSALARVPNTTNTRERAAGIDRQVLLEQPGGERLAALAARYGYPVDAR